MSRYYSDPARESDTYALPDVEVFYAAEGELGPVNADDDEPRSPGWYYWYCFPGCLPEGDHWGPYDTEEAAVEAMREESEAY